MTHEDEIRQRLLNYREAARVDGRVDDREESIRLFHQFAAADLEWALREIENQRNHIRVLTREMTVGCSKCRW